MVSAAQGHLDNILELRSQVTGHPASLRAAADQWDRHHKSMTSSAEQVESTTQHVASTWDGSDGSPAATARLKQLSEGLNDLAPKPIQTSSALRRAADTLEGANADITTVANNYAVGVSRARDMANRWYRQNWQVPGASNYAETYYNRSVEQIGAASVGLAQDVHGRTSVLLAQNTVPTKNDTGSLFPSTTTVPGVTAERVGNVWIASSADGTRLWTATRKSKLTLTRGGMSMWRIEATPEGLAILRGYLEQNKLAWSELVRKRNSFSTFCSLLTIVTAGGIPPAAKQWLDYRQQRSVEKQRATSERLGEVEGTVESEAEAVDEAAQRVEAAQESNAPEVEVQQAEESLQEAANRLGDVQTEAGELEQASTNLQRTVEAGAKATAPVVSKFPVLAVGATVVAGAGAGLWAVLSRRAAGAVGSITETQNALQQAEDMINASGDRAVGASFDVQLPILNGAFDSVKANPVDAFKAMTFGTSFGGDVYKHKVEITDTPELLLKPSESSTPPGD